MTALVRNWWMMAVRGTLAVLFGLAIFGWSGGMLSLLLVLFGGYAILDGIWALASSIRLSERRLEGWPVLLEGAVSLGLGVLALVSPMVSHRLIDVIAGWGFAIGVLEIVAAARLPRALSGHWLLGIGGVSSVFLAVLIILLPHADRGAIVYLIGAYALVFGCAVTLAAFRFRRGAAAEARRAEGRLRRARRIA